MNRTRVLFTLLLTAAACEADPRETCHEQGSARPHETFQADHKAPPMPPNNSPRKAGDGPTMAVVSDGSEIGKMFSSCGFEGGDPLYTSYEEWLGEESLMKYIVLETRVYTTAKNDTCVREWFESAGGYGVGSSGSDSTD